MIELVVTVALLQLVVNTLFTCILLLHHHNMYPSDVHHCTGFTDTLVSHVSVCVCVCACVCCFHYACIIQVTGYNGL